MRRSRQVPHNTPQQAAPENEYERFVFEELMASRREGRAVSRHMLSQRLHENKGLPPKASYALVETYCETEAPSVPEYLGNEFAVPYMKVAAFIFAILGSGLVVYSSLRITSGKGQWWWGFGVGSVVLLYSLSGWLRSLFREASLDR